MRMDDRGNTRTVLTLRTRKKVINESDERGEAVKTFLAGRSEATNAPTTDVRKVVVFLDGREARRLASRTFDCQPAEPFTDSDRQTRRRTEG